MHFYTTIASAFTFIMACAPAWSQNCAIPPAGMISVKKHENSKTEFWFSKYEVTNAEFADFVQKSGYLTHAEHKGHSQIIEFRADGSSDGLWKYRQGINWRQPYPGIRWTDIPQHPVVHVTLEDALAYAHWRGHDLPTAAEWELGANQGKDHAPSVFVAEPRDAQGQPSANYWQGIFPVHHKIEDGYQMTAPVGSYGNGHEPVAHDVVGNVWEITTTPFKSAATIFLSPVPLPSTTSKPITIKGGSYLCAENYCQNYHTYSSASHDAALPAMHIGFRTVFRSCLSQ